MFTYGPKERREGMADLFSSKLPGILIHNLQWANEGGSGHSLVVKFVRL